MVAKTNISVIVPVYKVERFIERCVRSLMEQTLAEGVEFIFVDDASPDRSMDIVREVVALYPNRSNSVVILRHDTNKGLPAARNTGLKAANGEYIFHCDSDDFVEFEMLELMLSKARKEDSDIVWCDWFLTFDKGERSMQQPKATTARAAVSAMLEGSMKYNVWNKLTRRSLYANNDIKFPVGRSMGEDMTMIRLAAKAKNVSNVSKPLYHYVKVNNGAMTHQYDDNKLAMLQDNVDDTIKFLRENIRDNALEKELAWFCLNVKLPFLFTGRLKDIKFWRRWYPRLDKYIMTNRNQALRTRLIQWCALNKLDLLVLFYYHCAIRVFYGVIYK